MSENIGKGDWIQCIDNTGLEDILTLNGAYYVEAVEPAFDFVALAVRMGLVLTGQPDDEAYCPSRFTKLNRGHDRVSTPIERGLLEPSIP